MNTLLDNPPLLNALHDRAHLQAEALRRAALDDFWRGADAVLATAATRTQRAAQRLAYRLQRRRPLHEQG